MKRLKHISIKSRIRTLILSTIFFLILFGCTISILIFSNILKIEKTKHLQSILSDLYMESVSEVQVHTKTQAAALAMRLSAYYDIADSPEALESHLKALNGDSRFLVYDAQWRLLFSSEADVFQVYPEAMQLKIVDSCFLGNESLGVHFYAKNAILDSEGLLTGYVITSEPVSQQMFIERINNLFDVDATIFYRDLRIVTSLVHDDMVATGTRLDRALVDLLLVDQNSYSGKTTILGMPYLTAYRSFGNPDESPIGIVFVGESLTQYNETIFGIVLSVLLLGLLLFLVAAQLSNQWLERNIVQPMLETTELMTNIADGNVDLSQPLDKKAHYYEFSSLLSSIFKMLTNLEESKQTVERVAYYDDLTGLPNRFNLFLNQAKPFSKSTSPSCLILLDLDDLNTVNDLYSRKVGDALIVGVSHFLLSNLPSDTDFKVYRINGGTFALTSRDINNFDYLKRFVSDMIYGLNQPFHCDSLTLQITLGVGLAIQSSALESVDELLHHAELAMYAAKRAKSNNYLFYEPQMSDQIREQKALEADLRLALENDEFFLVYQPKYNIMTGRCDSFEALIRWNSPTRGFVPPGDFIELAERSGLIVPIGKWVLSQSCQTIKELSLAHDFPYRIAVNISPVQINREDFFKTILEVMMIHGLEPSQLELEITENLLMTSFSSAVEKLRQLYVLGVAISVDDFGKGYSSLAYLQELPIHTLKIDKMFVDAIESSNETMISDIIRLGHHMNLKIVAEGVETSIQSNYLISTGCDSIQGYYYSRPLRFEQIDDFLSKTYPVD